MPRHTKGPDSISKLFNRKLPSCKNIASSNLETLLNFTTDIIDKQYRSYIWSDGKVQALATIDVALIAGILLIVQSFDIVSGLAFTLLLCSFLLFTLSVLVCLVHAIPRMNSRNCNEENLRTIIGISGFKKEEYHKKIKKLYLEKMLEMNCWQISGMVRNNLRSHKLIKIGVLLTILGVITIASALIIIIFLQIVYHPELFFSGQSNLTNTYNA